MNPFTPSKIANKTSFIGRKAELEELEFRLSNSKSERLLVLAPRRFGKTSLLMQVMAKLRKKKYPCVFMDIFSCNSIDDFANSLVKAIVQSKELSNLTKLSQWIKTNLVNLRANLKFQTDTEGKFSIEPIIYKNYGSAMQQIEEAFADLEQLGKKKQVILFIDEFQNILNWDKKNQLEAELRSITQKLENVNIVFSGSHLRFLKDIFESSSRPFFKQVSKFYLGKIDKDLVINWIQRTFKSEDILISDEAAAKLLSFSKNIPQQFQFICYELWNQSKLSKTKEVDLDFLVKLIDNLTERKSNDFELLWSQLTSNQKIVLKAIANKQDGVSLYSKDFLQTNSLTASTIQACLNTLEDKYLIINYDKEIYIAEPFFEYWLTQS